MVWNLPLLLVVSTTVLPWIITSPTTAAATQCGEHSDNAKGWCVCASGYIVNHKPNSNSTMSFCERTGLSFGYEMSERDKCECSQQDIHAVSYGPGHNDSFLCGPNTAIRLAKKMYKTGTEFNETTKKRENVYGINVSKECSCQNTSWVAMHMHFRVPCGKPSGNNQQTFQSRDAPHCRCVPLDQAVQVTNISGYQISNPGNIGPFLRHFFSKICERQLGFLIEACEETNSSTTCINDHPGDLLKYAIYPRSMFKKVVEITKTTPKKYNYCFVGAASCNLRPENFPKGGCSMKKRDWIRSFIDQYFDDDSYLAFTDTYSDKRHGYIARGKFDKTLEYHGFYPKGTQREKLLTRFDEGYWRVMASCKFVLTPAGDADWSMRFYEALAAGAIPVVNSANDYVRSSHEAILPYQVSHTQHHEAELELEFSPARMTKAIRINRQIFERYHLLPPYQ